MSSYLVIYEKTSTGYSAHVPDLLRYITTGDSLDNTRHNMGEAISGHLAVMREFGDSIPIPAAVAEHLAIPA